MASSVGERVARWVPVAVLAGAFVWSGAYIATRHLAEEPAGTVTIRIGHWQLETSVKEAFDQYAAEYRKTHPNVRIVLDAIPESTYGQWTTTQLMGGTAPDLVEIGNAQLSNPIWVSYQARYFVPLDSYAGKPNPYNQGTALAGVPLRQTYLDGMRSSYVPELQSYTKIGLSQFGERIFYNKNLLKELTGRDAPPADYRDWLAACAEIKKHRLPGTDQCYIPIASSNYHLWMWEILMADILTYPAIAKMDFNRDGTVDQFEHFVAFRSGRMTWDEPCYRARFKMLREVSDNFQPGWTGLGRDEAVFAFAQRRAVFMATGSWDARSLQAQAQDSGFEIGVMDFPLPKTDDPDYGGCVRGPVYEQPWTGFPFGLTRTSRHPDEAVDFLLFLASLPVNEKFNQIIGWVPAIKGAAMEPMLKAFEPHLEGVYGVMNFIIGGNTWTKYSQDYSMYKVNQASYDDLAKSFGPYYIEQGVKDYQEGQRDWRRTIAINEGLVAGLRGQALMTEYPASESLWIKYRAMAITQLVRPEIDHARQDQMVLQGKGGDLGKVGPYEYTPEALKRIKGGGA